MLYKDILGESDFMTLKQKNHNRYLYLIYIDSKFE